MRESHDRSTGLANGKRRAGAPPRADLGKPASAVRLDIASHSDYPASLFPERIAIWQGPLLWREDA